MAMKGKNCVAIAADRRFGIQAQMVTTDFQKIFPMGDRLYIGLAGLATDVQTVAQRLKFRLNLYELKEGRQIKPYTLMSMVANLLYEKRFGPYYTEPVIAGLDPKTFKPFICSLDLIGCPMVTDDFVVSGTCAEQMYGMCESLWEPNMDPEHLFETISQAMLNAVDRDAVSGMGVIVQTIKNEVDSTVNIIVVGQSHLDSNIEDQEIVTNPPDICQVVEVTTESDEQPVSMSELYPLQISPVSSYAESETTDSVPSDEESAEGRPHWRKRNIEGKQYLSNMGTRGSYLLPGMASFVTSNKPDLQVTIKEESNPVPYNSSWPPFQDLPLSSSMTPASSSSRPDRETRASVIKKTSDITQARVKSC